MTFFNAQVAETISNIVSFDANGNASQVALAASLFSIVVWAVAAWYFGIPTSESHALIAGLTGSAMALGGLGAVNGSEWIKVLVGLVVSTVMGFGGGYLIAKLVVKAFSAQEDQWTMVIDQSGNAWRLTPLECTVAPGGSATPSDEKIPA